MGTALDFNTSHVNVNLCSIKLAFCCLNNFNTSHVNVNLMGKVARINGCLISIHLMLMLIKGWSISNPLMFHDFNTSHVNVNLNSRHSNSSKYSFQYISC